MSENQEKQYTEEQLNTVTRNEEGQVEIDPTILTAQIQKGWKKDQLAAHYELPMSTIGTILKSLGLKIRKFHKPAFVIKSNTEESNITEETNTPTEETVEENTAEDNQETSSDTEVVNETSSVQEEETVEENTAEEIVETAEEKPSTFANVFQTKVEEQPESENTKTAWKN